MANAEVFVSYILVWSSGPMQDFHPHAGGLCRAVLRAVLSDVSLGTLLAPYSSLKDLDQQGMVRKLWIRTSRPAELVATLERVATGYLTQQGGSGTPELFWAWAREEGAGGFLQAQQRAEVLFRTRCPTALSRVGRVPEGWSATHVASWSLRGFWHRYPEVVGAFHREFEVYARVLRRMGVVESQTQRDPVIGGYDGAVLFSSFLEKILPNWGLVEAQGALRKLHKAWHRMAIGQGYTPLSLMIPYYGVVVADGDSLEPLVERAGMGGEAQLGHLANCLNQFSHHARALVLGCGGRIVESGEDLVVALLPVQSIVGCIQDLGAAYKKLLPRGLLPQPSLSAGISISQHPDQIFQVMEAAYHARAYARQGLGRDAWALRLEKRAGAPLLVGGGGRQLSELGDLVELYAPEIKVFDGLSWELPAETRLGA